MGMERKEHDMISRTSMAFLFSREHRLDTTRAKPFKRTYERAIRAYLLTYYHILETQHGWNTSTSMNMSMALYIHHMQTDRYR